MVRIIKFKKSTSNEGKDFISLKIQGGVEAIQSEATGRFYLTARTTYVATTFDETTAQALVGTSFPGMVKKVVSEPYQYTIKESGEVVSLSHRFEYVPEEAPMQNLQPSQEEVFTFAEA